MPWKNRPVFYPGDILTPRDLLVLLTTLAQADPNNAAWDSPLEVRLPHGDQVYAYKFEITDITDECDGTCQHPQCVYALDRVMGPGDPRYPEMVNGDVPKGYLDEGLHFAPTLWLNKDSVKP